MKILLLTLLLLNAATIYPTTTTTPTEKPKFSKRGAFILGIKNPTISRFFNNHYRAAEKLEKSHNIPMSISLAQWFIESKFGTSKICRERLNFGGIRRNGEFVCYDNVQSFYLDYAAVLSQCCYEGIDRQNINSWVDALQWGECNYAQSLNYKRDLLKVIEKYKLDTL